MTSHPLTKPTAPWQTGSSHPSFRVKSQLFRQQGKDSSQLLRLMVFYVQERLLGLPLSMVSKVLRCPDGIQINAEGVGLLELRTSTASQTMVVMDLAHLFSQTQTPHPVQDPFMILIQSSQAETCALTIQTMPALVDLALTEVTPLPTPLRQDPAYRFVSHIATLTDMDPPQRLHIIGLGKNPLFASPDQVSTLLLKDSAT